MFQKKVVALVFVCAWGNAFAQSPQNKGFEDEARFFYAGLKVGINTNKTPSKSYGQGFAYSYLLGGFLQFNFNKRFAIQPELNWLQGSAEKSKDISDIYDDIVSGEQKSSPFNRLEIPLLVNMNVGQSKYVKLQAGPYYSFYINNKRDTALASGVVLYNKPEFGLTGGIWLQLPFVYIGGRYKYGFTKQYLSNVAAGRYNQSIQVFIGFTVP
jgi:hypothetical protein